MEKQQEISLSVRDLVEFVLSSGDIDNRRTAGAKKEAMQEGGRLHRKIQRRMGSSYQAEVTMKHVVDQGQYRIQIEGRADGVITEPGGCIIDEIKCMASAVSRLEEPIPVHLAQAMCYGYFWCLEKGLSSIGIQLTYCHMETEEIRRFRQEKSFDELEEWFAGLIHEYQKWADYLYRHGLRRQESLKELVFPYPYRKGQRELAVDVYRAIARKRNLYIQAPTGIGKTLSVIFPSLKAMGEGKGEKLFYLTAKTITRRAAEEALEILRQQGLYFSSITITAKEKMCFLDKPQCNPEACPYAKGHFDRVNDAVFHIIHQEFAITRDKVAEYARTYQVCPFEFSLDISSWVDGIICDYNYVFDPNACLKRYFGEGKGGGFLFLVDEAHNLVPRAREMYSAALVKEDILLAKRLVKARSGKLARLLEQCNKAMLELKRECEDYQILEDVNHLGMLVSGMYAQMEEFMEENPEFEDRDLVLDFYFQVRDFLSAWELMDEGYERYSQMTPDGRFQVVLFCIDPSGRLKRYLAMGASTIFFSATLLPVMYYKELLSGEREDYAVYAESPFPVENRLLLVARDVSSRYSRRNAREYEKVAAYIREIVAGRQGNYLVFCPSYPYLERLEEILLGKAWKEDETGEWTPGSALTGEAREKRELCAAGEAEEKRGLCAAGEAEEKRVLCAAEETPEFALLVQRSRMEEEEREAFLARFRERGKEKSLLGLCVMGGIFGEGIDLKAESLIGVIIVGTGLPMVGPKQDILRRHFDQGGKPGFAYAYQYPGMNKVMQAAGRVIRTMEDEGVIALLDDRFLSQDYLSLFPKEWSDYQRTGLSQVGGQVRAFWERRAAAHAEESKACP